MNWDFDPAGKGDRSSLDWYYDSYILVLNLDLLGFQTSKQKWQEISGLIIQSILAKTFH